MTASSSAPGAGHASILKRRTALTVVASNAAFTVGKAGVGIAIGSLGVLSDALHSAVDVVASTVAWASVRAADVPPDDRHPYGHGKVESLSGLAESALIAGGAAWIIVAAMRRLAHPLAAPPRWTAGILVMAAAAVVNALLSWHVARTARACDSPALAAEGRHLGTDVATSLAVLAGLVFARATGRPIFDPLAALAVAAVVLGVGARVGYDAVTLLLDTSLPATEEAALRAVLDNEPRVRAYHRLRTRRSGSERHADVHVLLDDDTPLVVAHALGEEIEDRIRAALPALHINLHLEPYDAEMRHQAEAHHALPYHPPRGGTSEGRGEARR